MAPMSLAIAEPVPRKAVAVLDDTPAVISGRGIALSAVLHVVLGTLLIVGLPRLFDPPTPEEIPVAVQLVTAAPETRATHPNPNQPRADAKPDIPEVETPVAKPEPKPRPFSAYSSVLSRAPSRFTAVAAGQYFVTSDAAGFAASG